MKVILGKKIGMTTFYTEDKAENVTVIDAGRNEIIGHRTEEKDGYIALQVKFQDGRREVIREFRLESLPEDKKIGTELTVEQFTTGDKVIVRGRGKGKGFQGVVKRHGFAGAPASHGHRHDLRAPGSIGSAFPERVMKGKKMAGRMGGQSVTIKNLEVVWVDKDKNLLAVRGAVPGNNGGVVKVISQS